MYSPYIIDGVQMDYTPAQMLDDCMPAEFRNTEAYAERHDSIVDEIVDPEPKKTVYDGNAVTAYTEKILARGCAPAPGAEQYPKSYTAASWLAPCCLRYGRRGISPWMT